MLNIMNNWFILFDTAELLSEETETITIHWQHSDRRQMSVEIKGFIQLNLGVLYII
jgi:hypothetical protein